MSIIALLAFVIHVLHNHRNKHLHLLHGLLNNSAVLTEKMTVHKLPLITFPLTRLGLFFVTAFLLTRVKKQSQSKWYFID